jgi:alpha-glucosidase
MLASLLMSLRGSVCVYQGEELGLTEAEIPFERIQDPYGISFWPKFKGRDGCRTPMVWENEPEFGGFSSVEPWLPIPHEHTVLAVSEQVAVDSSLLEHYRRFLNLRKRFLPLVKGSMEDIQVSGDMLTFVRKYGNEAVYCAFNMGEDIGTCDLPEHFELNEIEGHGFTQVLNGRNLTVQPFHAAYVQLG